MIYLPQVYVLAFSVQKQRTGREIYPRAECLRYCMSLKIKCLAKKHISPPILRNIVLHLSTYLITIFPFAFLWGCTKMQRNWHTKMLKSTFYAPVPAFLSISIHINGKRLIARKLIYHITLIPIIFYINFIKWFIHRKHFYYPAEITCSSRLKQWAVNYLGKWWNICKWKITFREFLQANICIIFFPKPSDPCLIARNNEGKAIPYS